MGQMINDTVFGAVKTFDIFVRPFEFLVNAGIFNWQCNQISDRRQQLDIGLIKITLLFVDRAQHPDHPSLDL